MIIRIQNSLRKRNGAVAVASSSITCLTRHNLMTRFNRTSDTQITQFSLCQSLVTPFFFQHHPLPPLSHISHLAVTIATWTQHPSLVKQRRRYEDTTKNGPSDALITPNTKSRGASPKIPRMARDRRGRAHMPLFGMSPASFPALLIPSPLPHRPRGRKT